MTKGNCKKTHNSSAKCECYPTNWIGLKLQFALRKIFQGQKLGIHENLLAWLTCDQRTDEIRAVIQEAFGREISHSQLTEYPTIELLALHMLKGITVEYIQIEQTRPRPKHAPVFILGGSFDWKNFLNTNTHTFNCDVFIIPRLKNVNLSQPPTVEGIASQHLKTIRALTQAEQFTLVGYCFHGLVAYELARLWMEQGGKPLHLVLFDTNPTTGDFRKWVKLFFDIVGKWKRWSDVQKSDHAYIWMHRAERLQRWLRLNPQVCLKKVRSIISQFTHRLCNLLKSNKTHAHPAVIESFFSSGHPLSSVSNQSPHQNTPAPSESRREVFWAIASYEMKPLSIPVTLFLSDEWAGQINIRFDRNWSKWVANIKTERIGGNHLTFMATNNIGNIFENNCAHKFACWQLSSTGEPKWQSGMICPNGNTPTSFCLSRRFP
jgi:hypothetical protein